MKKVNLLLGLVVIVSVATAVIAVGVVINALKKDTGTLKAQLISMTSSMIWKTLNFQKIGTGKFSLCKCIKKLIVPNIIGTLIYGLKNDGLIMRLIFTKP